MQKKYNLILKALLYVQILNQTKLGLWTSYLQTLVTSIKVFHLAWDYWLQRLQIFIIFSNYSRFLNSLGPLQMSQP